MKIDRNNYIEQLNHHNEDALVFVIDEYAGLVKSIVKKHLYQLNSYQEECCNDVFLGVWNHINCYDKSKSTFKNWIAGIARYKAIDYLRKHFKEVSYEVVEEGMAEQVASPSEWLENEISEEVQIMLSCLNPKDRELFYRIYLEEESLEQVSQEMGLKKENIYNRISRSKKKIRKLFPIRRGY